MRGVLRFSSLSSVFSSLQIDLHNGQATRNLIVTSVGVFGDDLSFVELFLESRNALLIGEASRLQRLALSV